MTMIRILVVCAVLFLLGSIGCVGEGDLQIFRADIMALERSQRQRERALIRQLDAFELRAAQPIEDQENFRHHVTQQTVDVQALQVEVKALGDSIQALQRNMPLDADAVSAMQAKLDVFNTRLDTVADRVPVEKSTAEHVKERPRKRPKPNPKDEPPSPSVTPVVEQPALAAAKADGSTLPSVSPSSGYPAKQLYEEALKVYQEGAYDGAVELFQQFLYEHAQSPLAGDVQYRIGESLYAQHQYEKAVVAFDDVMQKYPDDDRVPAAMFKQALAFAELRDINSARLILQQIREKYANSPEANQATEKLKQLRY